LRFLPIAVLAAKGASSCFTVGEAGEGERGWMVVGNNPKARTHGVLALQKGGNCHGVDTPGLAAKWNFFH
jgi:hypothetical protein